MRNYQRELEELLTDIRERTREQGTIPRLFLHSCCAPCSSYVLEYLSAFFPSRSFITTPISGRRKNTKSGRRSRRDSLENFQSGFRRAGRRDGFIQLPLSGEFMNRRSLPRQREGWSRSRKAEGAAGGATS